MNEKDIRRFLRDLLLPTALGAGLALGACSDDSNGPQPDGKKTADAAVTDSKKAEDSQGTEDSQVADQQQLPPDGLPTPYMAPDAAPLHQHLAAKRRA
jgi:hypothetical protein